MMEKRGVQSLVIDCIRQIGETAPNILTTRLILMLEWSSNRKSAILRGIALPGSVVRLTRKKKVILGLLVCGTIRDLDSDLRFQDGTVRGSIFILLVYYIGSVDVPIGF